MLKYKEYYFCNLDFGKQLTGVERAALKRARLFKNYFGISPIFLTSRFNNDLQENVEKLKEIGWMPPSCEVFNVYEYLRGAYTHSLKINKNFNLDFSDYNIIDVDVNPLHQKFLSKTNNGFYKYVVWSDIKKTKIVFINNLFNNKIIKREKFDREGRLFAIQELNEKGQVDIEDLIHVNGKLVLQRYFGENSRLLKIVLFNDHGMVQEVFNNEEQLVDHWLKKIINFDQSSCFIIDRNPAWNIALRNFHKQNGHLSISIFHSSHLIEMEDDIIKGNLNSNFKPILENKYIVDHMVTLTHHQKEDILKRFKDHKNIVTIPHTIDCIADPISFDTRDKTKIVALCRLAPEKQVVDMVLMMNELLKTHPEMKLYIYGDGSEKIKVLDKIKELNLENNILLEGYIENIELAYNDAVFSLLTSRCEGFSLAILESLTYGVPAVSYNIPYGPSSMIQDDENGFLVEHGDYKAMAEKIKLALETPQKVAEMCEKAYASIDAYKEENVAKLWGNLILN